jgi:hypothetical protein
MTQNGTGGLVVEQILLCDLTDGKEKYEIQELEYLECPYDRFTEKTAR